MERARSFTTKKVGLLCLLFLVIMLVLIGRLVYLMIFCSDYYSGQATEIEERERDIKAARGRIVDAKGNILATNKTVCTISVIHSQIDNEDAVIQMLMKELKLSQEEAEKRVEKVSSIERVKTNVSKKTGDKIREYGLAGVKVDEDYKRYYPYEELASAVLGFTGGDNQWIIGLESYYDKVLEGTNGKILTLTDARGVEITKAGESRMEPIAGNDLYTSLDYNIQTYAQQLAEEAMVECQADSVEILVMNPTDGSVMAMTNVPEFNLNEPFTFVGKESVLGQINDADTKEQMQTAGESMTEEERMNRLNEMWRNHCVSDTYEPGSTFKVITTSAALEDGVVRLDEQFSCGGSITVEDTRIRCHKTTGHGSETFVEGIMNSCNPVFIQLGLRVGVDHFYEYFQQFGLLNKTGIDLPGEARTIMHQKKNVGQVELATIAFGQPFQITPVQLATTVSSLINGGHRVVPHVALEVRDASGKYIASFVGFAPADEPRVLALVIIHNPKGIYYGGTIAAPVASQLFANILPYLGIEKGADLALQNE